MKAFSFFAGLAIGFAVLVGGAPTSKDDIVPLNITMSSDNMTSGKSSDTLRIFIHRTTANFNKGDTLGVAGYDPSFDYFDYSTVQVWIGREQQTVGWVIEKELYEKVWGELDRGCPDNSNDHWGGNAWGSCHDPKGLGWYTQCLINPPFGNGGCKSQTTFENLGRYSLYDAGY